VAALPRIVTEDTGQGDFARYQDGVAVGSGIARQLGLRVGDSIRLLSPDGARTPFGTSPRVGVYDVVYIFSAGRYDIDATRIYMPFAEAQSYFNRDGVADQIELLLDEPEALARVMPRLWQAAGPGGAFQTWQDTSGAFLRALEVEDNVMFVILSVLVLIAAINIVSGLIMLVKNKQTDIGILRTIGLTEGAVLRVFFICGASVGVAGTLAGVVLGCLFAIYIDPIFALVNGVSGGGVWDPSIRGIYFLPAELRMGDVLTAIGVSLGLSFVVTIFPARRAARMNPVEALRHG
jgi:lipoprotein-releasing system permease protein